MGFNNFIQMLNNKLHRAMGQNKTVNKV